MRFVRQIRSSKRLPFRDPSKVHFDGNIMGDDNKDPLGNNGGGSNPWMKSLFIWAGILLALVLFVQIIDGGSRAGAGEGIAYSDFLNRVDEGSVKNVTIGKDVVSGELSNGEKFRTYAPQDVQLVDRLKEKGVAFSAEPEQQTSVWL